MIEIVNLATVMAAPEFPALVLEYSEECAIDGMPSPIVQFEGFEALESTGVLRVAAATVEGELVGFMALLVDPLNTNYGTPLAVVKSLFVAKARRGTGAGLGLLAKAEDLAKELGSPGLFVSAPVESRLQPLLVKLGYAVTNVVFFKKV